MAYGMGQWLALWCDGNDIESGTNNTTDYFVSLTL
jgi:hypothetical protein